MAVFYVTEYAEIGISPAGRVTQAPVEPPIAEQTVAIGVGSAPSSAFNAKTKVVRITCDAVCSFLFGTNPTAAATSARLAAGSAEYHFLPYPLPTGFKVAVITNT